MNALRLRRIPKPSTSRCFNSYTRCRAEDATSEPAPTAPSADVPINETASDAQVIEDTPVVPESVERRGKDHPMNRVAWLKGDGAKYRRPLNNRPNWLGSVPFPMNPTFAPKAPLAESTRDRIFETFKEELVNAKGGGQNVALRQTAQLHNVSMDRAKAVIRLKVHEEDLKGKGVPMQTEFQKGMESTLGCNRYDTKPSNKKNQPAEAESQSTIARATETPDGTRPIYAGDRQLFDFIDEEAGETSLLSELFNTPKSSTSAPTSRRVPPKKITTNPAKPNRPALVLKDVQGTEQALEWERTNANKSASKAVREERMAKRIKDLEENKQAWINYKHT